MHLLRTIYLAFGFFLHVTESQFETGMSGDRRVVVQMFEWTFEAIKEECKNVLGPKHFGAVLVSPITENVKLKTRLRSGKTVRPWFERYQPVSWNIMSRSGSEEEFRSMVDECNKNDVRVYVDVVLNHGVYNKADEQSGDVVGVGGTHANVKTKSYTGLGFDSKNFHDSCFMDGANKTAVRVCEIWGLQDINQTQTYVQDKIVGFLNKLIGFGVAGFRIDAAKHMWPADLFQIYSRLNHVSLNGGKIRMRPHWAIEVVDDGSYQEEYKNIGSEYDFSLCGKAMDAFMKGTVSLTSIYDYAKNPDYVSKTVQAMSSNQDLQRIFWNNGYWESSSRSGIQQVVNAFILTFSKDTPNIFSGYSYKYGDEGPPADLFERIISPSNCSDGWMCEHRFEPLQWVIENFTNFVKDAPIGSWWSDNGNVLNQVAFTRGQKGFAVFNADTADLHKTFKISFPPGIYCDLATGYYSSADHKCLGGLSRIVEVKEDGTVDVSLPGIVRTYFRSAPPYLVISVKSMYQPEHDEEEETIQWRHIAGWIALGVGVILVILVLGRFYFYRRSRSDPHTKVTASP